MSDNSDSSSWNKDFKKKANNQDRKILGDEIDDSVMGIADSKNSTTLSPECDYLAPDFNSTEFQFFLKQELAKVGYTHISSSLGLRLTKSKSFLSFLESRINNSGNCQDQGCCSSSTQKKIPASNLEATSLQIGVWQRISKRKGDLTAKFYYSRGKLIWEMLDERLKRKIEMQLSDIVGIKISLPENQMEIELSNPPLFFKESEPQPKKHSNWEPTTDFTNGQATLLRIHCVKFSAGILNKHIDNLLQLDHSRLLGLSREPFPSQKCPYFHDDSNVPMPLNPCACFNEYGSSSHLNCIDMNQQGMNSAIPIPQEMVNLPNNSPWINCYPDQFGVYNGGQEMNSLDLLAEWSLAMNTMNNYVNVPTNNHSTYNGYQQTNCDVNGYVEAANVSLPFPQQMNQVVLEEQVLPVVNNNFLPALIEVPNNGGFDHPLGNGFQISEPIQTRLPQQVRRSTHPSY